jgi:REP element-mobilizing transposase RayT
MGRSRYRILEPSQAHFLTFTVVSWTPVFCYPECAEVVLDSLRFLQEEDRLVLYAYVIMENHIHLIASAENLAKEVKELKSWTAREIVARIEARGAQAFLDVFRAEKEPRRRLSDYQVWQPDSHPKAIDGLAMMQQKVEYIHNNPVRRGYVDDPVHWRYSSARNYFGLEGLIPVTREW